VYGKLRAIQKALGKDEFPLIEQAYVQALMPLRARSDGVSACMLAWLN
jgi:hypothetical protein